MWFLNIDVYCQQEKTVFHRNQNNEVALFVILQLICKFKIQHVNNGQWFIGAPC